MFLLALLLALAPVSQAKNETSKAGDLYRALYGVDSCGKDCVNITNLKCKYDPSSHKASASCTFREQGKEKTVRNKKARRIAQALMVHEDMPPECGAGNCWTPQETDVFCSEKMEDKKLVYECETERSRESCLSAERVHQLITLEKEYEAAREAAPGCETLRGAGSCLNQQQMLTLNKLKGEEKGGCKVGARAPKEAKKSAGDAR